MLKRTVFIFICVLFFLFVIEISLRILGQFYSRKDDLEQLNDNEVFSIVCLGDSFTYGWGVDTAYTYPRQLERILNDRNPQRCFKVFNLAVPGSNSSQHLKYLQHLLHKYKKIDLVILLTGTNDRWNLAYSNIDKFVVKRKIYDKERLKIKIFLADLRIYKTVKIMLLNLKGKTFKSEVDTFKQVRRSENIDEHIFKQSFEYNLIQIIRLGQANNVKIILQDYPWGDVYEDNMIKTISKRYKVPFVEHSVAFSAELKELSLKDLFIYDNSHPNEYGCKIMAEGLYKVISKEIISE